LTKAYEPDNPLAFEHVTFFILSVNITVFWFLLVFFEVTLCFGVVWGHSESYIFTLTNTRKVICICTWYEGKKQLWYRRNGGGKAFINSLIGVQSGIKYDHFCPYATHFIYITAKSVQGPNIFLTMKCVICQGKQTWDRIPTPNPSVSILFPRGKVRTFSIVNQQLSPIRRMTLYSERCPCRKALVV